MEKDITTDMKKKKIYLSSPTMNGNEMGYIT